MKYQKLYELAPSTKKIVDGIKGISILFSNVLSVPESLIKQQFENSKELSLIINDIEDVLIKQELVSMLSEYPSDYFLEPPTKEEILKAPLHIVKEVSFTVSTYYVPSIRIPYSLYSLIFEQNQINEWIINLYEELKKNESVVDIVLQLLKESIVENNNHIVTSNKNYVRTSLKVLNDFYKEAYQMVFSEFEPNVKFDKRVLFSLNEYISRELNSTPSELNFNKMVKYLKAIELYSFLSTKFEANTDTIIGYLCRHYVFDDNLPFLTLQDRPSYYSFCLTIGIVHELMNKHKKEANRVGKVLLRLYHFFEQDIYCDKDAKDSFSRYITNRSLKTKKLSP